MAASFSFSVVSIIIPLDTPSLTAAVHIRYVMTFDDIIELITSLAMYSEADLVVVYLDYIVSAHFGVYPDGRPSGDSPVLVLLEPLAGESVILELREWLTVSRPPHLRVTFS